MVAIRHTFQTSCPQRCAIQTVRYILLSNHDRWDTGALAACAGNLVLEGGRDRVVFRLLMEVERLEATFNYESASAQPLLLAAIEDVRFNLSVNPGTLVINASLGNMRAQDCVLPEVCQPSSRALRSLTLEPW